MISGIVACRLGATLCVLACSVLSAPEVTAEPSLSGVTIRVLHETAPVRGAVVEAGAYTRAAKSLGLSQSTVSETLSALERRLGSPLFRKSRNKGTGPTLTPAGETLLPYARKTLALTHRLFGMRS